MICLPPNSNKGITLARVRAQAQVGSMDSACSPAPGWGRIGHAIVRLAPYNAGSGPSTALSEEAAAWHRTAAGLLCPPEKEKLRSCCGAAPLLILIGARPSLIEV